MFYIEGEGFWGLAVLSQESDPVAWSQVSRQKLTEVLKWRSWNTEWDRSRSVDGVLHYFDFVTF